MRGQAKERESYLMLSLEGWWTGRVICPPAVHLLSHQSSGSGLVSTFPSFGASLENQTLISQTISAVLKESVFSLHDLTLEKPSRCIW